MSLAAQIRRLEQFPLIRVLLYPARRVWRWGFGLWFAYLAYRELPARAALVLECPDLARLPLVPNAGQVEGGTQVMHNGILVEKGSYYGSRSIPFFRRTRGIHEPQEEIAFALVLPHLPPGATMLELGSYWAFYSIWFARVVPAGRCHLVEAEPANLEIGSRNFRLNGLTPASASCRFIGREPGQTGLGPVVTTVDQLAADLHLTRVHLLHADIQGHELEMLDGARDLIAQARIDWFFISTHGEQLHAGCRDFLTGHRFELFLDVPQADCFSTDGILVACRPGVNGPDPIALGRKKARAA